MSLFVALVGLCALGGTVAFEPNEQDLKPGQTASFELRVIPDLLRWTHDELAWDALAILVGSDTLTLFKPVLSQGLTDGQDDGPDPWDKSGSVYSSAWAFGGFFGGGPVTNPHEFLVATVDVQVPGDAVPGDTLLIEVNTENEPEPFSMVTLAGMRESLAGVGTVNVVPEPATILLFGLAALALICRRQP